MIEDALKYVRKYSSIDYTYAVENQYPTCIVCIKKKTQQIRTHFTIFIASNTTSFVSEIINVQYI